MEERMRGNLSVSSHRGAAPRRRAAALFPAVWIFEISRLATQADKMDLRRRPGIARPTCNDWEKRMAKVAFVYPGQGSQQPGMGADLLVDPEVADLCDRCSSAAGVDLRHLLTSADDEELRLTQNAQPALTNARRPRVCSADLDRFASGSASSSD